MWQLLPWSQAWVAWWGKLLSCLLNCVLVWHHPPSYSSLERPRVKDIHCVPRSPPLLWHKVTGLHLNGLRGAGWRQGERAQMDARITLPLTLGSIARNPVRDAFLLHEKPSLRGELGGRPSCEALGGELGLICRWESSWGRRAGVVAGSCRRGPRAALGGKELRGSLTPISADGNCLPWKHRLECNTHGTSLWEKLVLAGVFWVYPALWASYGFCEVQHTLFGMCLLVKKYTDFLLFQEKRVWRRGR